jgi:hypothetical protein
MPKGGPESFYTNVFSVHSNHPRLLVSPKSNNSLFCLPVTHALPFLSKASNAKNAPAIKQSANPTKALELKKAQEKAQKLNVVSKDKTNAFFIRHYGTFTFVLFFS